MNHLGRMLMVMLALFDSFGFGFDGIEAGPGVIAAQEGAGVVPQHTELTRHTGAGGLVGSRTVRDHPAMFGR